MQRVLMLEVHIERAAGVGLLAEVVEFAPDLLRPHAGGMCEQWKFFVGLAGLLRRAKMKFGHANLFNRLSRSLTGASLASGS